MLDVLTNELVAIIFGSKVVLESKAVKFRK